MKAWIVILSCIISVYTYSTSKREAVQYEDMPFRGTRNVEFDWQLTKRVLRAQKSNTVISPFSVKILLVLLYEATGAADILSPTQIKKELRTVLEPEGNLNRTRNVYRRWLDSALEPIQEFDLKIATKFFVEEYIDVISKYRIITEHYYSTTFDNVPFSNPELAANTINRWINDVTHGRIPNIISPDGVEGAVITLVNAIHFKGLWTYPFPTNGPRLTFHGSQKQVQVDFMEQNGQFYYDDSATLNAQLLRLSYRGGKFAMYFMLPHQDSSIEDVLYRVTPSTLHQALWYMDETEVNVTIPKFTFDFSEELIEPLRDIGIREIFSQNASLPLLARGKGARNQVRVSRIFQKAIITVNESGSEAYIAAEDSIINKFGDDGVQIFNANRPFLFFIEDEDFGTMLFVGRMEDPSR